MRDRGDFIEGVKDIRTTTKTTTTADFSSEGMEARKQWNDICNTC